MPVTATLAEELKTWRKVQTAERMASVWWGEGDFILSTPIGTRWDPSNARKTAFLPVTNGDPEKRIDGVGSPVGSVDGSCD